MPNLTCHSGNPDYPFDYCPSIAAAIIFTILFGTATVVHIWQAWHYSKHFLWVLIMGGIWETIAFMTRILEIKNPENVGLTRTSFLFILLAPMWINASDYLLLGRMVYFYMPDKKVLGMRAERIAASFVLLDITSFFIQLAGGLLTLKVDDPARTLNGLHIYTAGVCVQESVILGVAVLVVRFQRRLMREVTTERLPQARRLLLALCISLALITYRIGFRIVEFSGDITNSVNRTIDRHELFVYVFDAVPMFLALITFNIYHPGRVLVGPDSEYPKVTKAEKHEAKEQKRRVDRERNLANSGDLELNS